MTDPDFPAEPLTEVAVSEPLPDHRSRLAEIEAEAVRLRAGMIAGLKAVLRVVPPHSSLTWGGYTVTSDPTEVPASAVPGLQEAAGSAGVTLIQET